MISASFQLNSQSFIYYFYTAESTVSKYNVRVPSGSTLKTVVSLPETINSTQQSQQKYCSDPTFPRARLLLHTGQCIILYTSCYIIRLHTALLNAINILFRLK